MVCAIPRAHLRSITKKLAIPCRSLSNRNDIKFADHMELLDTSIPTMEKILTILQDAESNKIEPQESHEDNEDSPGPKGNILQKEYHAFLGLKVVDYDVLRFLNDAEVVKKDQSFENIKPETCEVILKHYAENLRQALIGSKDSPSLASIGDAFLQSPVKLQNQLRPRLKAKAMQSFSDFEKIQQAPKLTFDFQDINLPNPFRGREKHPMQLRKGLSLKRRPNNLLCFLLDDEKVLATFLRKLKSSLKPALILNFMKCQSLEGNAAFKILLTKHLKDPDSVFFRSNPLDSLGGVPLDHLESELTVLKAIVAHKSNILLRLNSFGIYQSSVPDIDLKRVKTSEDIVMTLARSFDRYFGACYRLDARSCDAWVAGLLKFYHDNWNRKEIFEAYFLEGINEFRDLLTRATLRSLLARWSSAKEGNTGELLTVKAYYPPE